MAETAELLSDWDLRKNQIFDPKKITSGSDKEIWWRCSSGHELRATVRNRAKSGCTVCSGQTVLAGFNDLLTQRPELKALWHPSRNAGIDPSEVSPYSNRRFWWLCEVGHHWLSSPSALKSCPYCLNRAVWPGFNDLQTLYPDIAAQWHPKKNGRLRPFEVTATTHKKVWWSCELEHAFQQQVNAKTLRQKGCPFCTFQRVLPGFNDLATTHPALAKELHPRKNGPLVAEDLISNGGKTLWWLCDLGHEYEATIASRKRGSGCPFCSGRYPILGETDLATVLPKLAAEFHPTKNSPREPTDFTPQSNKRAWWLCGLGHEFEMVISNRSTLNQGCPVCSNQKVLKGLNDLATKMPELAREWHPSRNLPVKPDEVPVKRNEKFWWLCPNGHEYFAQLANRAHGTGCPECSWTGFNSTKPAGFYFLKHRALQARKVGITNTGLSYDRIKQFTDDGWELLKMVQAPSGAPVRRLETKMLQWLRLDLEMPAYLGREEMGRKGGWTETFSIEGPSDDLVKKQIETFWKEIQATDKSEKI